MSLMWSVDSLVEQSSHQVLKTSGFVQVEDAKTVSASNLHPWLLSHCASSFFRHHFNRGLTHWSRCVEVPYVLSQVARFSQLRKTSNLGFLDNACGIGSTSYVLASLGFDIQGSDLFPDSPQGGVTPAESWSGDDAKSVKGEMAFASADSLELPFGSNHFDGSYSISSLEHMPDPARAIREMVRVTKSGGLVCFSMDVAPYGESVKGESNVNISNFLEIQEWLRSHCDLFAPARWSVPGQELSWQKGCRKSSPIRNVVGGALRRLKQEPDLNFYIYCGSWIKR